MSFLSRLGDLLASAAPPTAGAILSDPVQLAARVAWGEARGEGTIGMHAVLSVVGNRVADPGWWGRTILTVCTAHEQFSCMRVADPNFALLMAVTARDPQFAAALGLARQLDAGTLPDVTHGADSYFALGTPRPAWARPAASRCTIGHQEFFHIGVTG